MSFFCINCKSGIDPTYKACPFCGEAVTDFLRKHLEEPIDGKYRIISRLGIGGMGEVYKVEHIHLHAARVVKLMRPAISKSEDSNDRFMREARLATRIQHPNVATLFDFSMLGDGSYYMVWEFIHGLTLADLLRRVGRLSPRSAARIAIQALHGLDAIHRAGIVHRDISPENIMLTRDDEGRERVKIIDLGIAKESGDPTDDKTKTGVFVGKWKYCSPEQLGVLKAGERIDGRADLYSFGIVLYEALSGTPPFLADTPHRYLLLHSTETPPPFSARPELGCPAELESLVFRALEKERDNRFATAREFAIALEAILPQLPDEMDRETVDQALTATIEAALHEPTVRTESSDAATAATIVAAALTFEKTETNAVHQTLLREESPTVVFDTNRRQGWRAAVATIVTLIVIAAFVMTRTSREEEPPPPSQVNVAGIVTPASATLALNAYPWGRVATVRDIKRGSEVKVGDVVTPALIQLPPGEYEVTVTHPSYAEPIVQRVALADGARRELQVAFADAAAAPLPDFGGAE